MEAFVTATTTADQDATYDEAVGKDITFTIDGVEVTALAPTSTQLMMFFANFGATADTAAVVDILNFYYGLFNTEQGNHIKRRLNDRSDPFSLDHVREMLMALIEEWAGRPTSSPQDSPVSRRTAGRKSTAAVHGVESTRSA